MSTNVEERTGRVTELSVRGMTCNNCARHVNEALTGVPGVKSAQVNLEAESARVVWRDEGDRDQDALIRTVEEAGYKAAIRTEGATQPRRSKWSPLAGWHFNVFVGTAITLPLIILEWGVGAGMERWYKWLSFFVVLPLQVFGGYRFYIGAWNQLKAGQSNMDTLVSLGSTSAFLYSVWGLFAGWEGHLFFMDAAAIITLISVGHFLEGKMSAQAASSLKALLNLAPEMATRVEAGGESARVKVSDLALGDRVMIRPGDRVPTDGIVVSGSSTVNESMLTGESLPVEKAEGAKVFAGTLNESGQLVFKVTATGEATALAHIIQIVQQAQSSRANIQRLGDKISSVFVPIVVCVAVATAIFWGFFPETAASLNAALAPYLWHTHFSGDALASAIFRAAAVLIIACPCAMGLATPIAIMAGTNAAAKRGILIRDGAALEKSGKIDTVLFDKTGTLTEGKLSVAAYEEVGESKTQKIAAALARPSTHPLSRAVATLSGDPLEIADWREVRGSGVEGRIDGDLYRLGSLKWLESVQSGAAQRFAERWTAEGCSVIVLTRGEAVLALVALRDAPKAGAEAVIEALVRSGKRVYMVTGDNRRTAEAIAGQLRIPKENVHSEVRPEEKAAVIQGLQSRGLRVAFAGDGINDAPALEQADLGIALSNASDVARESADIILLKAELEGIPEALGLAQATLRTIKQNLFWAFFYNAAGVPLAALGFLSPIFSAFAMGASDLIVVGNALRLRFWK